MDHLSEDVKVSAMLLERACCTVNVFPKFDLRPTEW